MKRISNFITMSNPLKKQPGYFYCEMCVNKMINIKEGADVKVYKRVKFNDITPNTDWVPLCKGHSKGFELHPIQ